MTDKNRYGGRDKPTFVMPDILTPKLEGTRLVSYISHPLDAPLGTQSEPVAPLLQIEHKRPIPLATIFMSAIPRGTVFEGRLYTSDSETHLYLKAMEGAVRLDSLTFCVHYVNVDSLVYGYVPLKARLVIE